MKLNTNSNAYTIIYAAIVVVIVAFILAFVSSLLKPASEANERIDTKKQILASLGIRNIDNSQVEEAYSRYVTADMIVNAEGEVLKEGKDKDKDGFTISRKEITKECLPFYVCNVDSQKKYVIPMVGKGLWGGIWGYIALNDDGTTIHGAYFSHESETAGLGSLIKEEKFQEEFRGKTAYTTTDSITEPALTVVKNGLVKNKSCEVDGISGATLTSNGVRDMIAEYLEFYKAYLQIAVQNSDKE